MNCSDISWQFTHTCPLSKRLVACIYNAVITVLLLWCGKNCAHQNQSQTPVNFLLPMTLDRLSVWLWVRQASQSAPSQVASDTKKRDIYCEHSRISVLRAACASCARSRRISQRRSMQRASRSIASITLHSRAESISFIQNKQIGRARAASSLSCRSPVDRFTYK